MLAELQMEILGTATRYGMRQSPVIVGHTHGFDNIVDCIGPPWDCTAGMLEGIRRTMARTAGAPSILRASIASFGFVYIHPMSDGNGRIARFLVNDVLRRDGAVSAPFILPISATITNKTQQRVGYDRALKMLSRPLMSKYQESYRFGAEYTCPDGVRSNFYFDAYDDALPTWRYPDLTLQSEYIGNVIRLTIEVEMSKEASCLRDIERAREGVKDHLEGPNSDIDLIIRSVRENGWKVSSKLVKTIPALADPALADAVVVAVKTVFEPGPPGDQSQDGDSSVASSVSKEIGAYLPAIRAGTGQRRGGRRAAHTQRDIAVVVAEVIRYGRRRTRDQRQRIEGLFAREIVRCGV